MQVIPFNRAALLLAATLATGTALGAEQVERDDAATPAAVPARPAWPAAAVPPAPPAVAEPDSSESGHSHSRTQAERDRDARLEEAKKRLEQAAAEVAALSSEIASQAMQGFSSAFGGPRRSIIGVQLEAAESGAGARVKDVSPGGAAAAAGVRVGDVIVAVNGTAVKGDVREVVRMLREVQPDTVVHIRVMRDGKPKDLNVTTRAFDNHAFANVPPDFDFDFDFDPSRLPFGGPGALHGTLAGMEVTALTPQLAKYFGTDKGLLVVRAPKNDLYKLQDGDVILNIDGRVPTNGSHITRILRSYQPGERLTLHIMRDRKPLDLEVTLPDESRNRRVRATRLESDSSSL